jgi:UDP-N-acetylglucosamine transferase subunit ALG13
MVEEAAGCLVGAKPSGIFLGKRELTFTNEDTFMEPHGRPILAIASSGGHLTQLLHVAAELVGQNVLVVTDSGFVDRQEAEQKGWVVLPKVGRSLRGMISTFFRQFFLIARVRPVLVLTTGSGWCLPALLLAPLIGADSVFLESFSRIDAPSGFGKVATMVAGATLVQWPELKPQFSRAILVRPVFRPLEISGASDLKGTLVSVGTHDKGMDRLVKAVDEAAERGELPPPVFVQVGSGAYVPRHIQWARSLPRDEFGARVLQARLIISHAGVGIVGQCIEAGKVPVVVPRFPGTGEIVDDHQVRTARRLSKDGLVVDCEDLSQLAAAAARALELMKRPRDVSAEVSDPSAAAAILARLRAA